ncbi:MAG: sugar ABC transporter substrate-binding protein [Spirochaetales bacterium]|nr:sugar ABC transporter substrate-binding protein [Spirochaetales bacterium]
MKSAVCIFLSVFLVSLLSSCEKKEQQKSPEGLQFFYSPMDLSNPYFRTLTNGMKDRANELGIRLTISDGESRPDKQIQDLDRALEEYYDLVICSPLQPADCIPLVKKAREAGIPFINPNQTIPGSDAHINLDDFSYGRLGGVIAGTWISEMLPPDSKVLIIGYTPMEALQHRSRGIKAGILEKAPEAVIVEEVSALTPEAGMVETEKALQRHQDIRVIAAVNDAAALGAMTAVNSLGIGTENFCIVGLDATSEYLQRMDSPGSLLRGTVDINPYGTGKTVIDTAIRVLREGPLEETVSIDMTPVFWDGR